MGQRSDDFDILLTCICGHEQKLPVATPLMGPIQRTCPRCGSAQLHARAEPPAESDMVEQVDHFVRCAISSLKPIAGLDRPSPTPRSSDS